MVGCASFIMWDSHDLRLLVKKIFGSIFLGFLSILQTQGNAEFLSLLLSTHNTDILRNSPNYFFLIYWVYFKKRDAAETSLKTVDRDCGIDNYGMQAVRGDICEKAYSLKRNIN